MNTEMLAKKIQATLTLSAIGDAMGAATEALSYDQIRETFGGRVETFLAPGKTAYAWGNEPGETTDDFSQAYYLCNEVLANDGALTKDIAMHAMIKWSQNPRYDRFVGPTTSEAIKMYKEGRTEYLPPKGAVTVDYSAKATNGAAMKISPAGLLHPDDVEAAVEAAFTVASVTHDNNLAISGASAVAAAVSASLSEHATIDDVLAAGYYGAVRGDTLGKVRSREVPGASVVKRIELAAKIAAGPGSHEERLRSLYETVGSGIHIAEAVPCAFGIAMLNRESPLDAVLDAVNVGYDTDTVATIVGAMVGALADLDDSRVAPLAAQIEETNHYGLDDLAKRLAEVALR